MSLDGNSQRNQGLFSDHTVLNDTVATRRAEILLQPRNSVCPGAPKVPQDLCHPGVSREAEVLHADLPSLKEGASLCLTHHQETPPQPQTLKEQESSARTQATYLTPETGKKTAKCGKTMNPEYVFTPRMTQ